MTADVPGVAVDDAEPVDPATRDALLEILRAVDLDDDLDGVLAEVGGAGLFVGLGVDDWRPTADVRQHTSLASYQLGGDATSGWSAVVEVNLPGVGQGGSVGVTVDVGLNLERPLPVAALARALVAAATLAGVTVPTAIAPLLSPDAGVATVNLHVVAENDEDEGNIVDTRVDLAPFGDARVGRSLGVRTLLGQPPVASEIARLVVDGIERMLLDAGFTDPRKAMLRLREDLGLAGRNESTPPEAGHTADR